MNQVGESILSSKILFLALRAVSASSLQTSMRPSTVMLDSWSKPVVDKHEGILHDVFLFLRVVEGVKKTAISQAKSSIASEHTRNTCDLSYAAPLEIERREEREREREGSRARGVEVDETERPTRHSFRLTAYLIKTTLSRPACAVNDAAHGPCNRQTKRERVAAEREWVEGREGGLQSGF